MRALGMMSGTSLDGIDLAIVETDGETISAFGPVASFPYDEKQDERRLIFRRDGRRRGHDGPDRAAGMTRRGGSGCHPSEHRSGARIPAQPAMRSVDVIGFHGQTVVAPAGDRTDRPTRRRRAMAGGRGSPVVSMIFAPPTWRRAGRGRRSCRCFIGHWWNARRGPAPLRCSISAASPTSPSWTTTAADPIACDVGPANALLDDFMLARTGAAFDADGAAAECGAGRLRLAIADLLGHDFFDQTPPKSLDRNSFREWVGVTAALDCDVGRGRRCDSDGVHGGSDGPDRPASADASRESWIVVGGGARNPR